MVKYLSRMMKIRPRIPRIRRITMADSKEYMTLPEENGSINNLYNQIN